MKSFEDVAGFHGHVCPGLALGYRVALFALRVLGDRSTDEEASHGPSLGKRLRIAYGGQADAFCDQPPSTVVYPLRS